MTRVALLISAAHLSSFAIADSMSTDMTQHLSGQRGLRRQSVAMSGGGPEAAANARLDYHRITSRGQDGSPNRAVNRKSPQSVHTGRAKRVSRPPF